MAFKKYTQGRVSIVDFPSYCVCGNSNHQIVFKYFKNEAESNYIYCSFNLSPEKKFIKRIWKALKYIFRSKEENNQFEQVLLDQEKINELKSLISVWEMNNKIK